jgi:hypothetical protein
MKTITIPKRFGYPTLDITVNGKVYTVKSGEEITIEDHIAEAIENAIALEPKPRRNITQLGKLADGSLLEITARDLGGITSISSYAFYYIKQLLRVEIPSDVTNIGDCTFYGCSNLESVRFEANSNLKSIGLIAFDKCDNLSSVYLPSTPPALPNADVFKSIKADCVFYCKTQESLNAYMAAPYWSTLAGTYTFVVEE